jgi:hypothetical protein
MENGLESEFPSTTPDWFLAPSPMDSSSLALPICEFPFEGVRKLLTSCRQNYDWTDADPMHHVLQQVQNMGEFSDPQLQTSVNTVAEQRATTTPKGGRNQKLIVSCGLQRLMVELTLLWRCWFTPRCWS